jgi:hypothetical protein
MDLKMLLNKVISVFSPAKFSVSVQVSSCGFGKSWSGSWGASVSPFGYVCSGTDRQDMPFRSVVVFHTFQAGASAEESLLSCPVTPLALCEIHPDLWVKAAGLALVQHPSDHDTDYKEAIKVVDELQDDPWEMCSRHRRNIMDVLKAMNPVAIGPSPTDVDQFVRRTVVAATGEIPFYLMDLGLVLRLWRVWESAMPRVKAFYAVKCNTDQTLLSLLAKAGAGFDVASKAELAAVRKLRVPPDRVIFANPCKLPSHIVDAATHGVLRTTFHSETELFELSKYHSLGEVVLRIPADDIGARCHLGVKYGADLEECEHLLVAAKAFELKVVGVAFHVGSGASHAAALQKELHLRGRSLIWLLLWGCPR